MTRGLQKALRRGPGLRHAARRADHPRPGARRGAGRAAADRRRSSTSPTSTTPRTSCAARPRRCGSSPTGSTPTAWSSGSPALAYQKGFGGHFHNDNALGRAARHPRLVVACPSSAAEAPELLRTWPGSRSARDAWACCSSRSRSTTTQGDGGAVRPPAERLAPPGDHGRGMGRLHGDGRDVLRRDVRQRRADGAGGPPTRRGRRGARSSTCAGWRRCRSLHLLRGRRRLPAGAGRRRDPALRRRLRRSGHGAGRGRLRRSGRAGHRRGLLHPAGPGGRTRAAHGGRRGGCLIVARHEPPLRVRPPLARRGGRRRVRRGPAAVARRPRRALAGQRPARLLARLGRRPTTSRAAVRARGHGVRRVAAGAGAGARRGGQAVRRAARRAQGRPGHAGQPSRSARSPPRPSARSRR